MTDSFAFSKCDGRKNSAPIIPSAAPTDLRSYYVMAADRALRAKPDSVS